VAANEMKVIFRDTDRLEIVVRLHLSEAALRFHDIDNRLKDIFDALQGRAGGSKSIRTLAAIIPNDKQIFRALIEKFAVSTGDLSGGDLTIKSIE
jgi:Holliday junction resolvase RusA-like endonuclease